MRKLIIFFLIILNYSCSGSRMADSDRISGKIIKEFAQSIKNTDLCVVGSGGSDTIDRKIKTVAIRLDYDGTMNIEIARKLVIESSLSLISIINTNPNNKEHFDSFPACIDVIDLAIFTTDTNDPAEGEISIVDMREGEVDYCVCDHVHYPLLVIHRESFEEACRLVNTKGSE